MANKTRTYKKFMGLEYLEVTMPVRHSAKAGDVVDVDPLVIEMAVARFIVEHPIPIRGIEAKLLRKFLGLSMERFAAELDLSGSTVCKWEKELERRIGTPNEIAVRVMVADRFGIAVPGKLSALKGREILEPLSLAIPKMAAVSR